jgi:hypothetical protein
MLVYDYILTFGDEIEYIWRRPVTSVKVIYLILRYGVALGEIFYFRGECLLENACDQPSIHMAYIALSGLTTNMSHNVRILLVRTPLS